MLGKFHSHDSSSCAPSPQVNFKQAARSPSPFPSTLSFSSAYRHSFSYITTGMGNITSCCDSCCAFVFFCSLFPFLKSSPVQGRRSQSYEPLLLENEREAVADLLQYLESMCFFQSHRSDLASDPSSQTEQPQISFLAPHCLLLPHFHFPTMSIFNGAQPWLLQRLQKKKFGRSLETPWTQFCFF